MRLSFLASLILFLAQAPQTDTWPPPGVHLVREAGVTAPRVVTQVKPAYTTEALRAHVQGGVILECVVDIDGSVGAVKVKRSLDPTFGLDRSAIDALKQWRFMPATKDGMPVRVLISVELTFSTRPGAAATSLPAAFIRQPNETRNPALDEQWTAASVDVAGFRVGLSHPSSWVIQQQPAPPSLLNVYGIRGASRFAAVMVLPPPLRAIQLGIRDGLSEEKLKAFADGEKARMPLRLPGPNLKGVGQARFGPRYWLWVDVDGTVPADVAPPPGVRPELFQIDPYHMWVFSTSEGDQMIQISLTVVMPKGSERDVTEFDARAAADVFGEMLNRVTIDRVNDSRKKPR